MSTEKEHVAASGDREEPYTITRLWRIEEHDRVCSGYLCDGRPVAGLRDCIPETHWQLDLAAVAPYIITAVEAERDGERLREHQRRARIAACDGHRVERVDTRGFRGCVAVAPYTYCNPAAHGGCCEVEHCQCGALRERNINGNHDETGPWG